MLGVEIYSEATGCVGVDPYMRQQGIISALSAGPKILTESGSARWNLP